ncbi:hypothetical protein FD725_09365 [Nostoc sp. TCL26-01]|nr:hypothetical protein FD725_09365 [Nostoc sp. TCL26-01]
MSPIKRKSLMWLMCLFVGLGYFSAMSNLEIHYFWKSLIVFLPIQIIAIIYVTISRNNRD